MSIMPELIRPPSLLRNRQDAEQAQLTEKEELTGRRKEADRQAREERRLQTLEESRGQERALFRPTSPSDGIHMQLHYPASATPFSIYETPQYDTTNTEQISGGDNVNAPSIYETAMIPAVDCVDKAANCILPRSEYCGCDHILEDDDTARRREARAKVLCVISSILFLVGSLILAIYDHITRSNRHAIRMDWSAIVVAFGCLLLHVVPEIILDSSKPRRPFSHLRYGRLFGRSPNFGLDLDFLNQLQSLLFVIATLFECATVCILQLPTWIIDDYYSLPVLAAGSFYLMSASLTLVSRGMVWIDHPLRSAYYDQISNVLYILSALLLFVAGMYLFDDELNPTGNGMQKAAYNLWVGTGVFSVVGDVYRFSEREISAAVDPTPLTRGLPDDHETKESWNNRVKHGTARIAADDDRETDGTTASLVDASTTSDCTTGAEGLDGSSQASDRSRQSQGSVGPKVLILGTSFVIQSQQVQAQVENMNRVLIELARIQKTRAEHDVSVRQVNEESAHHACERTSSRANMDANRSVGSAYPSDEDELELRRKGWLPRLRRSRSRDKDSSDGQRQPNDGEETQDSDTNDDNLQMLTAAILEEGNVDYPSRLIDHSTPPSAASSTDGLMYKPPCISESGQRSVLVEHAEEKKETDDADNPGLIHRLWLSML